MSTKWSSQVLGKSGTPNFGDLLKDEFSVVLLQGKNTFGNMIYCYLKVNFPNVEKLQAALKSDASFTPSDFGEVIAAGLDNPPEEVKAEVALIYPMIAKSAPAPANVVVAPVEKKAWDEY